MGIYSRDYYRDSNTSRSWQGWGMDGMTPAVKLLIIVNVAVFLLQIFVVREVQLSPLEMMRKYDPHLDKLLTAKDEGDPEAEEALKKDYPDLDKQTSDKKFNRWHFPAHRVSVLQEWFELDTKKVVWSGQMWRLLTHAFCHDRYGVWHILINMLLLYWFGGTLESMYGSREFILFYLTAAIVAGLAFVGLDLYTGSSVPGIGASGAVMGVMMLYTMHFPYETIRIFWIFPVEMRWVMLLYAIWDLHPVLLTLSGDHFFTGIAHAAHLGGLAFGFLYARYQWRLEPLLDRVPSLRWKPKKRPRLRLAPETVPESEPQADAERVDQLLAKIFQSGQASLTDEERTILQKASERIKKRPTRDA
jgi:membrane associated rhomboid family serine protease